MPPNDPHNSRSDPVAVETSLRRQFTETFERADYPLTDPFSLIPLLPEGADTEFRAGSVVVPAIDLGLRYSDYQQYPYDSVGSLVEDLITGLKAEKILPTTRASTPRTDMASSPEENPKS
jgi:hypothetical protein